MLRTLHILQLIPPPCWSPPFPCDCSPWVVLGEGVAGAEGWMERSVFLLYPPALVLHQPPPPKLQLLPGGPSLWAPVSPGDTTAPHCCQPLGALTSLWALLTLPSPQESSLDPRLSPVSCPAPDCSCGVQGLDTLAPVAAQHHPLEPLSQLPCSTRTPEAAPQPAARSTRTPKVTRSLALFLVRQAGLPWSPDQALLPSVHTEPPLSRPSLTVHPCPWADWNSEWPETRCKMA